PGPDGFIALLGESQTLYILSPDGQLTASFPLPTPVYIFQGSGFEGGYNPLYPTLMADGSVLVVSEGRAYALNSDGSPRWEFPIDQKIFSPPAFDPVTGQWYLIDRLGTLYAFTATDGLLWFHDLEEGLKAASPFPLIGPNGEIYYTITTGSRGKLEALQPDGTPIWRLELTTTSFYDPLDFTLDYQWLILDDNLIEVATGRLLNLDDLEFNVTTFAVGANGKNYLLAGSSIMEWVVVGDGIQILNQTPIALPENFQRVTTPQLRVSTEGIYWLQIFVSGGQLQNHLWANDKGEIVSNISIFINNERIIEVDGINGRMSACNFILESEQLECRGFDGKSNDPVWQINIEDFSVYREYFYLDGRLYVWVDEDTIQVIAFDLPW
ncbi:MAG TPA: PQQ-binding-like beta-propeller repeat protein, partial [Anaerolineales bacterium]|nr:PQQ-binding-like beta-propeller repeat protein [Anaerolineales bacterium]